MIKALILDIDGVLVGEKIGFNSPDPHPLVSQALKIVTGKGISISLCTAKPHYAIKKLIDSAELHSPHITDGGAVIINPLDNSIIKKHVIEKEIALQVIKVYVDAGVYTEFYTLDGYFAEASKQREITKKHSHILQTEPTLTENLVQTSIGLEITKIMPIAQNEEDKKKLVSLFEPFKDKLSLSWGVHPVALPHQFGIITTLGITKKQGAIDVMNNLGIPMQNALGVGDSTSDWQFIEVCGYGATMENASEELKRLVVTKRENGYIAGHADENGALDIFTKFKLL